MKFIHATKPLFIKNAVADQGEKMNAIVNGNSTKSNDAMGNDKFKEPPYYERFISSHHSNHNDFLDFSEGMMGI